MTDPSKPLLVSSEFLKSYEHSTPSGSRHPQCLRHGLSNIGIDARQEKSAMIDLNALCDRDYQYICETGDDGWLVAGGEKAKLKRGRTQLMQKSGVLDRTMKMREGFLLKLSMP
ncbi:MAG: hypothetical protein WB791_03750 [Waddliaceae bacterium]